MKHSNPEPKTKHGDIPPRNKNPFHQNPKILEAISEIQRNETFKSEEPTSIWPLAAAI
jgi:hypothetical protein